MTSGAALTGLQRLGSEDCDSTFCGRHRLHDPDCLLAQAAAIAQWHEQWAFQRDTLAMDCQLHAAIRRDVCMMQQVWLLPQPSLMHLAHLAHLGDLAGGMADARAALCTAQRRLRQRAEELQEAGFRRQRLARCRLDREREQLRKEQELAQIEQNERERAERARLAEERARSEWRQAELTRERERLVAELSWQRERRWPCRESRAVQTDAFELPGVTPIAQGDESASYEEDFASDREESYEEDFPDESDDQDEGSGASSSVNSPLSSDETSGLTNEGARAAGSAVESDTPSRTATEDAPVAAGGTVSEIAESVREAGTGESIAESLGSPGRSSSRSSGCIQRQRSSYAGGQSGRVACQPVEVSPARSVSASVMEESFAVASSIAESVASTPG
mmetsp:Transcript_115922/g.322792  ORF Transcript_115922/g.322792 Transcript_115922/m.322792 type:complete len:392 (-) Transcript_115922:243-1418(-)